MSRVLLKRWTAYSLLIASALAPAIACTSDGGTEPTPTITVTLSPTSASVEQGGSTTVTVTVTGSGGFSASATITVEGVPAGVTGTVSGVTTSGGTTTATVTIDVGASVTPGTYPITVRGTASGVSDVTATFTLTVVEPPDFSVSVDPDSIEVEQTTSGQTTVNIGRTNFSGAVTLSLGGVPAGVMGTFNPAAPTGSSSTLTLAVDGSAAPGTYELTVNGTGSPGDRTATLTLVVTPEKIFSIAVDPDALTINQGAEAQSTVTITRTNFAGAVDLTLEDAPAGVTGTFDPAAPTGDNSTLTVSVDSSVTPGTYTLTVTGTTGGSGSVSADGPNPGPAGEASAELTLTVMPLPNFGLSVNPDSIAVEQGQTGETAVTITRTNFTGPVTLSLGGAPTGVTGTFDPAAPTGDNATLTVSVDGSVAPGTYELTVDGSGTPGDRSTALTLTVTPAPDYGLSVEPDSVTVPQGGSNQATVTIDRTNFTGPVTLTLSGAPAGVVGTFDPAAPTGETSTLTLTVGAAVPTGDYDLTVDGAGTPGARTTTLTLTVIEPADYSLAVEPDSIGVEQGMSAQVGVAIARTNFSDAVTLSLGNAPTGVTGTFDPAAPTGDNSTLTVSVDGSVAPGTYALTVDGNSSIGARSTGLTLTVTAVPDYALSVEPDSIGVEQGSSGQTAVSITRTNFTGAVTLSLGGAPAGVTGTFNPAAPTGDNSTLTVTVDGSVAPGTYALTVDGSGAPGARSTALTLTVTEPPDYALSVDPDSITVEQGMSGQTTVTIDRTNFTGAVTLSLGGAPAGVTGTFDPAAPTGDNSTLTVSVDGSVSPGVYALTVDGTGSPGARSTPLTLTVVPPPSFALTVDPDSISIEQGSTGQSVVTIARTNFTGAVTLSLQNAPAGMTGTFDPAAPTGDSSLLTVSVDGSVTPGTYAVKVSGTGGSGSAPASPAIDDDTDLTVTVTAPPGYTLSMSPSAVSVPQGGNTSATININRTGGFSESVSLSASGMPAGMTATPTPASTTGNSSTLDISVGGSVSTGTYTLTITGTASGVPDETTTIDVTVTMAGGGSTITVDFSACDLEDRAVWVAFQDGTGAWTQVMGTGDVYMFTITAAKGGVAFATVDGEGDSFVAVFYFSQSEMAAASPITFCDATGTKTVNATVAGVSSGESARISLGGVAASGFIFMDGPIQFQSVPSGPQDFVGFKSSLTDPTTGARILVKRDQDIPDMGSAGTLDFNGADSFAPATATVTLAGVGMGELSTYLVSYSTLGSCETALFYTGAPMAGAIPLVGVPSAQQASGELHRVNAIAGDSSQSTSRSAAENFAAVGSRTLTLGSHLPMETATDEGGPYKRVRVMYQQPPEYGASAGLSYGNSDGSKGVSVFTSVAANGGLAMDIVVPDLSGVSGFNTAWPPAAGEMVQYGVTAIGGTSTSSCEAGTSLTAGRAGMK